MPRPVMIRGFYISAVSVTQSVSAAILIPVSVMRAACHRRKCNNEAMLTMSELTTQDACVTGSAPIAPEKINGKINLLDLTRKEMRQFFADMGEKPFRADQVMKWIYHYCYDDFDLMTDINKVLRTKLKAVAEIRAPEVSEEQRSADGTIKWAIRVGDQEVETVYIPEDDRATLCVSSQVGCALECKFCSTAQQGFNRNLRDSEISGQV